MYHIQKSNIDMFVLGKQVIENVHYFDIEDVQNERIQKLQLRSFFGSYLHGKT